VNPDLGSRNNLITRNLFPSDPKHGSYLSGRQVLKLEGYVVDNQVIDNLFGTANIQGKNFVPDQSVVLADIDASSANDHDGGNCALGSRQFREELESTWPLSKSDN